MARDHASMTTYIHLPWDTDITVDPETGQIEIHGEGGRWVFFPPIYDQDDHKVDDPERRAWTAVRLEQAILNFKWGILK